MATRIFNTIELKDDYKHGKLTVLLGSAVIEFIADDEKDFKEFMAFHERWIRNAIAGETIYLTTTRAKSSFNARLINAIDITWPKK